MTETTFTAEQIHEYATQFKGLSYDAERNEYFSIYGQFAKPELVGTRRIVSHKEIAKAMRGFERDLARYGCE